MSEETKLETQTKSFRLPIDVIEVLERWAEETKQSVTQVLSTCVRESVEAEARIAKTFSEGESVLQGGEIGASVLQIRRPANRDGLADAITTLMFETADSIGVNDRISALGVARARVYKLTADYQAKKEREGAGFYSPYEDEKALAKKLSSTGGAGNYQKMREKSEK